MSEPYDWAGMIAALPVPDGPKSAAYRKDGLIGPDEAWSLPRLRDLPAQDAMWHYEALVMGLIQSQRGKRMTESSLTQAAQAFWEAATNQHERKHAERNGG